MQIFVNNSRNWWPMDPPPRLTWNLPDCLAALRFSFPDSATATQLCRRFAHCVCRFPNGCRLFRISPLTSGLCMLFFIQPMFRNCYKLPSVVTVTFVQTSKLFSILNGVKVRTFAGYSFKIRVIFSVQFESRKVDKKSKPTWTLKHTNSIIKAFEYLCKISSQSILTIMSYTVSKFAQLRSSRWNWWVRSRRL